VYYADVFLQETVMSELHVPPRHIPIRPPFHPDAIEPESEQPSVWDWTPRQDIKWQAAEARNAPLEAKRPLGGSEGIPETQPDTDDLLNVALTVIVGIGLAVVVSSLVRRKAPR